MYQHAQVCHPDFVSMTKVDWEARKKDAEAKRARLRQEAERRSSQLGN